jgi:hypothetical protein
MLLESRIGRLKDVHPALNAVVFYVHEVEDPLRAPQTTLAVPLTEIESSWEDQFGTWNFRLAGRFEAGHHKVTYRPVCQY